MKEKDDKLRLVKQILVDDNGINSIPNVSKDHPTPTSNHAEATAKALSCRSRRVSLLLIC